MEAARAIPCCDSLCQGQTQSAELGAWGNQSGSTWAPHPLPSQSKTQDHTVKQLKNISTMVKKNQQPSYITPAQTFILESNYIALKCMF